MRALNSQNLIDVWEAGVDQHALDRALTCLGAGAPDQPRSRSCDLSIGSRDAGLLLLRELTFGPDIDGFARCPACDAELEFGLDTRTLRSVRAADAPDEGVHDEAPYRVRFRMPSSRDIAGCVREGDREGPRRALLLACVVEASEGGNSFPADRLPDHVFDAIEDRMAASDALSEIRVELSCADCHHSWTSPFDIASFFWTEIEAAVRLLFQEIHALARAYGWSEAEILRLSPARRRIYLEMACA